MEQYGAALRRAKFALVVHGSGGVVVDWNAGAERLFGFTAQEAIGRKLSELVGTKVSDHEIRAGVRKDGTRLTCLWQEEPLDDGSVLATVTDVTESKLHERRLLAILDNLALVIWEVDTKGIVTFQDGRKGLEEMGLDTGAHVGQNAFELYREAGADNFVGNALRGTPTYTASDVYGKLYQTWTAPIFGEDGSVVAALGVSLDSTEIRKGELELRAKLELIEQQEKTIRELSTPLLETWDRVLTVPMVGVVDSERAAEVMEQLLSEITRRQARFAIVDLTGVEAVDTKVASNIINLARAIQLLGAEGIVTGIRPSTAQTMMMLGADLTGITTRANLKEALRYCIQKLESSK